jgi:OmcA/MtrC family decaheme c-type cytochrome
MVRKSLLLLGMLALILPLMFLGCGDDGSDGSNGLSSLTSTSTEAPGTNCANGGQKIEVGEDTNRNGVLDPSEVTSTSYVCNGAGASQAKAESCAVCHQGEPRGGDAHQAAYDQLYQDGVIQVTAVGVENTAPNTFVTTFTMTKVGDAAFTCEDADSIGIYFTTYAGEGVWEQDARLSLKPSATSTPSGTTTTVAGAAGLCTVTAVFTDNVADFTTTDGIVVVYGRDEQVAPNIPNSRVVQYKYPFAGLGVTGAFAIGDYVSAANASGCEKCHTVPYLKHGYIYGEVAGNPATDMYTCKACHLDNGDGGHFIWQVLVDDPTLAGELYAQLVASGDPDAELEDFMTDAEKAQYAYKTRLMNDVHMSHAMEFAYPQSMANCVTCHAGKLTTEVLTDTNFVLETCKSCHPVTGPGKEGQAPTLTTVVPHTFEETTVCNSCHFGGGIAPVFSAIHTGYYDLIYADDGTKFANAITVSIDNATLNGTDLTIGISASGAAGDLDSADITPAVLVGLYGYDTKDFIVNGHDRWDSNCNGTIRRNDPDGPTGHDQPIGEYVVGQELETCPNPYWTLVSGGPGAGPWVITAHLATWADMINAGTIKRVEIAVLPELENAEEELVGLNAVSRTFVLATGTFDDAFFGHDIVDVGKCNNCHDQLATTFHDGDRGGSITVCRMCHVTLSGGSHLEMQSRSIDSYVHAIHSFQAFDIGDIDFTDPFQALEYEHHIDSHFPTFGTENCLACHNAGKFNTVDQSKSLPGVLSASDPDIVFYGGIARNIGDVPSYITGPATRACGACHRAHEINEDNAGELASLFSHWGSFGTLVEAGDPPNDIYTVIGDLFSSF